MEWPKSFKKCSRNEFRLHEVVNGYYPVEIVPNMLVKHKVEVVQKFEGAGVN